MTQLVRLRLSRARGFNLQEHSLATNGLPAVNVARPSKWGNDCKVDEDYSYYLFGAERATAEQCVELHDRFLKARLSMPNAPDLAEIRGRNLACWCPRGCPCHADTLLKLANAPVLSCTGGDRG